MACGRAGRDAAGGGRRARVRAPRGRQRRAVVGHPAVAHHDGAVHQRRQRAELVGDEHDRRAAVARARPSASASACWLGRSTPAVGSSRKNRSGSPASARAMSTRCCWPPDRWRRSSRRRSARPTTSSASSIAARSARDSGREQPAAGQPAGGDDLPDRGGYAGGRAGALRHEADPLPARRSRPAGCRRARPGPAAAGAARLSARTSVDLPEPLAPISATNSPASTVRSIAAQHRPAADGDRRRRRTASRRCVIGIRSPPGARRGSARIRER